MAAVNKISRTIMRRLVNVLAVNAPLRLSGSGILKLRVKDDPEETRAK
jgi:hypothetical protein